jgi:hypothetical protein
MPIPEDAESGRPGPGGDDERHRAVNQRLETRSPAAF